MEQKIAIIGVGCRFPGADNPASFWEIISNKVDGIRELPSRPFDWSKLHEHSVVPTTGESKSLLGGFLEKVDHFDPHFFQISPKEAERLDPQQRLVLEVAWESLENAGIVPSTQLSGTQTGVFLGAANYDYGIILSEKNTQINAYNAVGTSLGIIANRLSYLLNLQGPSLVIDTACSSSLVALHYACQSLLSGESNLCLAGGVNLILSSQATISLSQAQMIAADGRCKTFDAAADGFVRGEGCGIVVLKRLSDALRDGDNIQAIIAGSAVNQDGLTNGLTAPNGPAQQALIRQALANAGVKPSQISYVETQGTGTSLGDTIEVNSLKAVLMEGREANQPCWIGSVKTNIGHLEAAGGIAGLIKVVLSLQHGEIPPHLHLKELNPYIKIQDTPIKIPTESQQWLAQGQPRLAGVSAFGFGGTNAHVILEEAPPQVKSQNLPERSFHLLSLSAKTEPALQALVSRYQSHLEANPQLELADICYTANTGRSHFQHRLAVVIDSKEQLITQLAAFATGKNTTGLFSNQASKKRSKIAFLFTGQSSQYINMGRQLYQTQPIFRQTIDQCHEILRPYLEHSLLEILYPDPAKEEIASSLLNQTAYTQPALFAVEYALYQLWQSWGMQPDAVMGHDVGEYVAATVAGVFSLEDALKLIAHRGRLMQELPSGGEMVSVIASEDVVRETIAPFYERVAIAAVHGSENVVVSGLSEDITVIGQKLELQGVKTEQLQISHTFDSPLMTAILAEFSAIANQITYNQPKIKLVSNVTGKLANEEITTAQYWVNHLSGAVQFAHGMQTLHQLGYQVFLEIGSQATLLESLIDSQGVWLPSLRPGFDDLQVMLSSLGQLYTAGYKVDWAGLEGDDQHTKVTLPTYPFQRERYWIET
ncbi:MAG: type I polyketide synthase, partial [Trichormus sp.]